MIQDGSLNSALYLPQGRFGGYLVLYHLLRKTALVGPCHPLHHHLPLVLICGQTELGQHVEIIKPHVVTIIVKAVNERHHTQVEGRQTQV